MTEYGRIHTDGSRSGGQPLLLPCPFCGGQAAIVKFQAAGGLWWMGECQEPSCDAAGTAFTTKAEAIAAWNTRQPTQSDALRDLVATLWCASGCSCCRDDDAWEKASHELAELLGIPKYDDGSGYDWYSVYDAAKDARGL